MSNDTARAILIVSFFGFCAWVTLIFVVVFALATQTDVNNWILALSAAGAGMAVGIPERLVIRSLMK